MIKKEKIVGKSALALSALGGIPAAVTTASADTGQVVYTHESGAGQSTITDNTGVANNSEINAINSLIRNLQTKSNGIVTISDKVVEVKDNQIPDLKNKLSTLSDLISQYNGLKAELDTQNNSNEALNGMRGVDTTQNVTGSDLNGTISNLQNLIKTMQDDVNYNKTVVGQNAFNTSQDRALNQKIKEANQTITGAANSIKHYKDGIYGDLDMVKRKSQDSIAQGGIVVDNTETQKINTIKTDQTINDKKTYVTTIDEANQNLDRILNNIKTQNQTNHVQAANAAHYRSNALYNIDDLNVWLTNMRQKAQDAKTEASKHKTSLDHLNSYKADEQRRMQEVIDDYKTTGAVDNDTLDSMNKALDAIKQSTITHENVTVGQKDPIDFADIGADPDAQNGSQDGSISNTKKTEMDRFSNDITNAINQAIKNDADANKQIDNAKATNDQTIETIKKVAAQARQYKAAQDLYNQRESLYNTTMSEYNDALNVYNDAINKFNDVQTQHSKDVADFKKAADDFNEANAAYEQAVNKFNQADQKFTAIKDKYRGLIVDDADRADYDADVADYNKAKADFAQAQQQFNQKRTNYLNAVNAYNEREKNYQAAKATFDQQSKAFQDAKAKHDQDVAKYNQLKSTVYNTDDEYNAAYAQYEKDSQKYIADRAQYEKNVANYGNQLTDYENKKKQYDADEATFRQKLAAFEQAKKDYMTAQGRINAHNDDVINNSTQFANKYDQYKQSYESYQQALAKYNTAKADWAKWADDWNSKYGPGTKNPDVPDAKHAAAMMANGTWNDFAKNHGGGDIATGTDAERKAAMKKAGEKLFGGPGQDMDTFNQTIDEADLAYQDRLVNELSQNPDQINHDNFIKVDRDSSQFDVISAIRRTRAAHYSGDMKNGTTTTAGYFWTNPALKHAIWLHTPGDGRMYSGTGQGAVNFIGSGEFSHMSNGGGFLESPWVYDYGKQYQHNTDYVTLGSVGTNDSASVIIPDAYRLVDKNGNRHWVPVKITMRLTTADGRSLADYVHARSASSGNFNVYTTFLVSAGKGKLHINGGVLVSNQYGVGFGTGGSTDTGGHGEGLLLQDNMYTSGRGGQALDSVNGSDITHGTYMNSTDFDNIYSTNGSYTGGRYQLNKKGIYKVYYPQGVNTAGSGANQYTGTSFLNGAGLKLQVTIDPVRAIVDKGPDNDFESQQRHNWTLKSGIDDTTWKLICDSINWTPNAIGDMDDGQILELSDGPNTGGGTIYHGFDGRVSRLGRTGSKTQGAAKGTQVNLSTDNANRMDDFSVVADQHRVIKQFSFIRTSDSGEAYLAEDASFGSTEMPAAVVHEGLPNPKQPPTPPDKPELTPPKVPSTPITPSTPDAPPEVAVPPVLDVPPVPPVPPKPPKHTFNVAGVNGKVTDLTVNDQNAKAKTVGEYNIQSAIEYLYTGSTPPETPKNVSANFILDQIKAILPSIKKTASNTSMVVRKQGDRQVRTASGNSLTVRVKNRQVKTASGNSLTVRVKNRDVKTASGNSLTVRVKNRDIKTASGNSLVVRVRHDMSSTEPNIGSVTTPIGVVDKGSAQKAYDTQNNSLLLNGAVPVVQQKWNGQSVVLMSVYADPSLLDNTKQAIKDWNEALKAYGVQIDATFTDNVDDLRNGVTIAVMDSDNNNEIISSWQKPEQDDITMSQKAGLTTAIVRDILHGNGLNDKYNTAGTITAGDTLENSVFTVQINREGIASIGDPNTLIQKTLTHELGHVFGLSHDMDDSLMTTAIRNPSFTGVISKRDAELAARQLVNDPTHPTDLFLK